MVGYYNQGVPTSVELENNTNQNKYTVNRNPKSGVTISKLALVLMALGVLLLLALAIGLTILLYPSCSNASPEALTQRPSSQTAVRLPKDLQPLHYRLQLMPFIEEGNFTTNGAVTITLDTKEATDKIVLNLYDIKVDKDSVKVKNLNTSDYIDISDQQYDNISQMYTISLKDYLEKGKQYELEIKFIGHLNDNMQGFYRSSYVDSKTNTTRWIASTQFCPTDARRAFPCFDEPAFKSKFTVSIARPNNMTTISNMPKRATDTIIDRTNWEWDHYAETPLMSPYSVAFLVSDFQAYRYNSSGKLLYTVWTRMKSVDQPRLAINLSPIILEYYEHYFDIKFPFPKIDLIAVPDLGFSAMENWGAITFRETAMLFDEKTATIEDKRYIISTLAHELAHQWFGNLVTPNWWNDFWLNEGFANYIAFLGMQQVEPTWNIMDEFLSSEVYPAFGYDYFKSSRPIVSDVVSMDDIQQVFSVITYSKGASIIRMLNHILGEKMFKEGLIKYLNQHQYKNVQHNDLWNVFKLPESHDVKLEATVKEIMDTWIKQAGFPVVTAIRNSTTGEVHVSQERFLFTKDDDKSLWWIPISYASDLKPTFNDTHPKFWLKNERDTTIKLEADKWWLLNLQQTGYYIVNYDEQNWRNLVTYLMALPPVTRVQLISDSMDLARANLLDYDIPLRMIANIGVKDTDISFIAYHAAFEKVSFLFEMLASSPIYKKFEDFIFLIFDRAFTKVDFNESPSDEYIVQRIRRLIVNWACQKSASQCTNDARILFRRWVENPSRPVIPPNLQKTVLCTAIREGGEAEWNLVYKQYQTSQSIFEKNMLLEALGCSQTQWILSRYLDFTLKNDTGIRKQDSSRVFKAVANNPVGYSLAFDYLRTHWKELNDHYGTAFNTISEMVSELPIYMNTPFQLTELENFKNNNLNSLGSFSQAFDRVIERVKANVEWKQHSYGSIEKWLDEHSRHYGLQK